MPLPIVFFDGEIYWLADGWHRTAAAEQNGEKQLAVEVRNGTREEALTFALGANTAHGLQRTNADKRRCVEIALREFSGLSDRAVAKMCGVGAPMVGNFREANCNRITVEPAEKRKGLDGKERKMPTTRQPSEKPGAFDVTMPVRREPVIPDSVKPVFHSGLMIGERAIETLKSIHPKDTEREQGLRLVLEWINQQLN